MVRRSLFRALIAIHSIFVQDWNALKDYVDLENASLVLTRSSDFLTAFGDLTTNQSFWQNQTQFSSLPCLFL